MKKYAIASLGAALLGWASSTVSAELTVSAAASLTDAFTEIGREFERVKAPHRVIFNFASSGALLQQISRGAPVDVFAAADQETMDRAEQQNLIVRASRADFARNTLVLVAPRDGAIRPNRLEELKSNALRRIAVSNPETVPAGKYAREALEAAGLFGPLKEKFITTRNVRQTLDYVARGEVDLGFVYITDAAIMPDKVTVLFEVPTRTPITYPIAAVEGSGKEELALEFVQFVRSAPAQSILRRHGFQPLR